MKVLRSPIFIIACVLFIGHQLLQKFMPIGPGWNSSYLDNLLAMPIILTLLLVERQYLFKKGASYPLPALDVIMATLFIIVVAEVIFPLFSDDFVTDWMDALFYASGSIIFYLTINRIPKKAKNNNNDKN